MVITFLKNFLFFFNATPVTCIKVNQNTECQSESPDFSFRFKLERVCIVIRNNLVIKLFTKTQFLFHVTDIKRVELCVIKTDVIHR